VPQTIAFIAAIVSLLALLPLVVLAALVVSLAFRARWRPGSGSPGQPTVSARVWALRRRKCRSTVYARLDAAAS